MLSIWCRGRPLGWMVVMFCLLLLLAAATACAGGAAPDGPVPSPFPTPPVTPGEPAATPVPTPEWSQAGDDPCLELAGIAVRRLGGRRIMCAFSSRWQRAVLAGASQETACGRAQAAAVLVSNEVAVSDRVAAGALLEAQLATGCRVVVADGDGDWQAAATVAYQAVLAELSVARQRTAAALPPWLDCAGTPPYGDAAAARWRLDCAYQEGLRSVWPGIEGNRRGACSLAIEHAVYKSRDYREYLLDAAVAHAVNLSALERGCGYLLQATPALVGVDGRLPRRCLPVFGGAGGVAGGVRRPGRRRGTSGLRL